MSPKEIYALDELSKLIFSIKRSNRLYRKDLPTIPDLFEKLSQLDHTLNSLQELIDHLGDIEDSRVELENHESPTAEEIDILLRLNRQLKQIGEHCTHVVRDVTPRLEAKLGALSDPMFDYEIDAKIDFILREDDPEYDEDDDNSLSSREMQLRGEGSDDSHPLFDERIYSGCSPEALFREPHAWLFHDLYDHRYGVSQPRLSLKNCLRVGTVFVELYVKQQYFFEIEKGEWIKAWDDDREPVYLEVPPLLEKP